MSYYYKSHGFWIVLLTYKICPKGTNISNVKISKKWVVLEWKKQGEQTSGYQIQYELNGHIIFNNPGLLYSQTPAALACYGYLA